METATVQIEKAVVPFTAFPEELNDFFRTNNTIIKVVPNDLDNSLELECQNIQITSADQYYKYLIEQKTFWEERDPKNKLNVITQHSKLKQALDHFNNAHKQCTSSKSQVVVTMKNSVNALSTGVLNSESRIAGFILNYVDASNIFISGIKAGLSSNRTTNKSYSVEEIDGILTALDFINGKRERYNAASVEIEQLQKSVVTTNENYSKLNARYMQSFAEHEHQLQSVKEQTDKHFSTLLDETEKNHAAALLRQTELEKLYEEKLKLQAPAQYWEEMEKNYVKSGRWWLVGSGILSVVIIAVLWKIFNLLPSDMGLEENWTLIFKVSAMIAVITSVSVYLLRLFVKMATSSFHLSRDAKERSKLSYFYLALIEKKAVTDKERAIILNSLFSRSDTGLLKGDASPVMSANVTDLVNSLTKKD